MKVICDNCGKKFTKKRNQVNKTNHNFCCTECFGKYKTEYKLGAKKVTQDRSQFDKLKKLGKERLVKRND